MSPFEQDDIANRNACFRAWFDELEAMVLCQRLLCEEVEMQYRYTYHDNGCLKQAVIFEIGDEPKIMRYDSQGKPIT